MTSLSDADSAAIYDQLNPWDSGRWPSDRYYSALVMCVRDVLDVGCGTGSMLCQARLVGHGGRLVGIDPDPAALDRAARRTDVEWILGRAEDLAFAAEFDLAVMASHAFQCFVTDEELRASLASIRTALRPGGLFAFETRHPQARAWEEWNPANSSTVDFNGRRLTSTHQVQSVVGDVVTFSETTTDADGEELRVDRATLRFLDVPTLNTFLVEAGFEVDTQFGDWDGRPIDTDSREIITLAQRLA